MTKLLVIGIEPVKKIHPCYAEFTYTPRSLPDDTTPMVRRDRTDRSQTRGVYQVCETHGELCGFFSLQCVLSMFEDMGFINTYKIDMHTLARSDNTLNVTSCDTRVLVSFSSGPGAVLCVIVDSIILCFFLLLSFNYPTRTPQNLERIRHKQL